MAGLLERLTQRALRVAAGRWPEAEREDAVAEWTAELHVIGDHPWRALRYAASLALARPDRDLGVARGPVGAYGRHAAVMLLLPLVAGALSIALSQAIEAGLEQARVSLDWGWYVGLPPLLLAVPLAFIGRRLGRGAPYGVSLTVVLLTIGTLLFGLATRLLPAIETGPGVLAMAVLGWAVVIWLTGWGLRQLHRAGRRAVATVTGLAGGLAAWIVSSTLAGLLQASPGSRTYAFTWWLLLLVDFSRDGSDLANGTFVVREGLTVLPYVLIPATVFGLAYLAGAGRRTGQAPPPALDTA